MLDEVITMAGLLVWRQQIPEATRLVSLPPAPWQVADHFPPAVPQGVVGIGMEGALEGAHAVLQVHFEQPLLDRGRRVVERQ